MNGHLLYWLCRSKAFLNKQAYLFIYDTENKRSIAKLLETSIPLDCFTCINQLPNGELFCYGRYPPFGTALIIDKDFSIRKLPSGIPCFCSSAIYYNRNIYCFGGTTYYFEILSLAIRYDMDENRWFKLTPMLKADSDCHCVAFNGNILISGLNKNILLYSVNTDSFSTIPFDLTESIRKIMINTERLYLIECIRNNGLIYESEVGDEYAWKQIGKSIIGYSPQIDWLHKKGKIYIGCSQGLRYYKFDLGGKMLIEQNKANWLLI